MTGMHACTECDRSYPSRLAAEDCADQDRIEADDARKGRAYTSSRG